MSAMWLRAKKVPWSSVVGQSIMLIDEKGAVACQLAILNVRADLDPKQFAEDVATLICLHFNSADQ